MALNNIQERVERSIFQAIRKVLATEGYLPANNPVRHTNDAQGQLNWENDLRNIQGLKGFATELFGAGSSQSKGQKRVPRVVIIPRRIMPGDIGTNMGSIGYQKRDEDRDFIYQTITDFNFSNLHIDINIVTNKVAQERIITACLHKAIGTRRFVPFYDNPNERFLMRQFNYYDLPNDIEGIEEKVYSYEVTDILLYEEYASEPTARINEIKVEPRLLEAKAILNNDGTITGGYIEDGNLVIDLSTR